MSEVYLKVYLLFCVMSVRVVKMYVHLCVAACLFALPNAPACQLYITSRSLA
jgi:hypothetical protein